MFKDIWNVIIICFRCYYKRWTWSCYWLLLLLILLSRNNWKLYLLRCLCFYWLSKVHNKLVITWISHWYVYIESLLLCCWKSLLFWGITRCIIRDKLRQLGWRRVIYLNYNLLILRCLRRHSSESFVRSIYCSTNWSRLGNLCLWILEWGFLIVMLEQLLVCS